MKNLEIIVTDEDGRIEMTVDDVDSFILRTKADTEMQELLGVATDVCRLPPHDGRG